MPNNALQRTPLARPLTWARSFGFVAHQRACRSVEVASGAAESRRWAVGQEHPSAWINGTLIKNIPCKYLHATTEYLVSTPRTRCSCKYLHATTE